MQFAGYAVAAVVAIIAFFLWRQAMEYRRAEFIRNYDWPPELLDKLQSKHAGFTRKETALVGNGLRQFFTAYLRSGRQQVSMPSEIADQLWHEFILYTRAYKEFCQKAFGGYFHHTPAVMLSPERRTSNAGLRRVWWQCCREENIDPRKPTRLPLLFALDSKLKIEGGYRYVADCSGVRRDGGSGGAQCGGDFSSSSVDGSTDGFGGGGDGGGDGSSGGDSGGDGGGGCGGGCGGGGGD